MSGLCTFLNNYQIMRNILNINNNSYGIFIYPRDNKAVDKEALEAKQVINIPFRAQNYPLEYKLTAF